MTNQQFIPRQSEHQLEEFITHSPAVLIHGPRQCGKTTLARLIGDRHKYTYYTFDNPQTLLAAKRDPTGFVTMLPRQAILDEIQLVPELFRLIKLSIDVQRNNGQYILTGSTNVLYLPELMDALTGRMLILRLHPLSQLEIEQKQDVSFLDKLFSKSFSIGHSQPLGNNLVEKIIIGGYPPALAMTVNSIRSA